MPTYDSGRATTLGALNIKARRPGTDLEGIRFDADRTQGLPNSANDFILFRHAGKLKLWDGTSTTVLSGSGAGSGAVPSWETIFAADQTFNVAGTTFTIDNSTGDNNVLTLTNSGGGAGNCIQITNAGTGNDIAGTSATWSVTKAGVGTFVGLVLSGTTNALTISGNATITLNDNSATSLIIGASGATAMITFDTTNGSETVRFGNNITVTSGNATLISASNTVSNVLVTNNTVTTFGNGANSAGVVIIRSTSLTTGTLLQLQATEGTMTTSGNYLIARDATAGGTSVFTISRYGTTTILGSASGTAALTLTHGDVVVSDGRVSATNVSVTTQQAFALAHTTSVITTGSVLKVSSTSVDTGTGQGTLVDLVSSASTAAVIVKLTAVSLTTGTGLQLSTEGLTTGKMLDMSHTTSVLASGGTLLNVSSTSIDTTTTSGALVTLTSTASTAGTQVLATFSALATGIGVSVVANALTSGQAVSIASSATAIATTGRLFSVVHSGATGTSAVLSEFSSAANDETVILKVTASDVLATGKAVFISVAAMTTGTALDISGMAAITTGKGINVAASGTTRTDGILVGISCASTGATSTGRMLLVNHTGNAGVSTVLAEIKSAAADETVIFQVLASDALAAGKAINVSVASMTTGTALSIENANALTSGAILKLASNSADSSARSLLTVTNTNTGATGTAPITVVNAAVQGTGSKFKRAATLCGISIWVSIDGTTPNGALTGDAVGDLCLNAATGKPLICTGTNVWAAVA